MTEYAPVLFDVPLSSSFSPETSECVLESVDPVVEIVVDAAEEVTTSTDTELKYFIK